MRKLFVVLGAMALTACTIGHETDLDKAEAKRQANIDQRHQMIGCTFTRDHDAYRNCLLNTHLMNSPTTYTPQTLQDGRPVAVIHQQKQQNTCGLAPLPESEEYQWAAPTTVSETRSVETLCQKKFEPQKTVIQTVEQPLPPPQPEVIFVEPEPAPQPAPQPVRWQAAPEPQPTCPCADPNDPCPQCYDK